jgi:hypothetical protein
MSVLSALSHVCSVALLILFGVNVWAQFMLLQGRPLPFGNPCRIIAGWLFFSRGRPGDTHLLYRDYLDDGSVSDWREVPLTAHRLWRHVIWHPEKRARLPLSTFGRHLVTEVRELAEDADGVQLSLAYLVILNLVCAFPALGATHRQFLFVNTEGFDADEPAHAIFCSAIHRLDAGGNEAISGKSPS